jgi:hypothetical protein
VVRRRRFTDAQRRRIKRYAEEHGRAATMTKYHLASSVYHSIVKTGPFQVVRAPAPKANGHATQGRDAVVYLRKAWGLIERDVRKGSELRDADLYVKLALNELTKPKEA